MNFIKSLLFLVLVYQAQARYTDQQQAQENERCTDCINLISTLKGVLNTSNTGEEIEEKLSGIDCSQFDSVNRICEHLVTFNPQMLDIVIGGDDSITICTNIRRCSPNALSRVSILPFILTPTETVDNTIGRTDNQLQENERCTDCINLISTLKDVLNTANTPEEVAEKLSAIDCSKFDSVTRICEHLVTFNPQMLDIVIGGDDSITICTNIRRCSPSQSVLPTMTTGENTRRCEDCVNLISTPNDVLNTSTTDEEAEMELNAIDCSQFGSVKRICKHLVTFTPQMLDIIILGEDSRTICTNIRRCKPTTSMFGNRWRAHENE